MRKLFPTHLFSRPELATLSHKAALGLLWATSYICHFNRGHTSAGIQQAPDRHGLYLPSIWLHIFSASLLDSSNIIMGANICPINDLRGQFCSQPLNSWPWPMPNVQSQWSRWYSCCYLFVLWTYPIPSFFSSWQTCKTFPCPKSVRIQALWVA